MLGIESPSVLPLFPILLVLIIFDWSSFGPVTAHFVAFERRDFEDLKYAVA